MVGRFLGLRWTRRGEMLLAIGVPLLAAMIYVMSLPVVDTQLDDSYYVVVHLPLSLLMLIGLGAAAGLIWRHRRRR